MAADLKAKQSIRFCDECEHFNAESPESGAELCNVGHTPRWCRQRSDTPHDINYGYKRRCEDYSHRAEAIV